VNNDHEMKGGGTSVAKKGKIAALVADAFQEEEYFLPKIALQSAGFQVEVISTRASPVEMYSFFSPTGKLDVDKAIVDAKAADYVGVLIPGGAKSPSLLAESAAVRRFVKDANTRGIMLASICRGSLLLAKSDVVNSKRITGFNDAKQYPNLVVQPHAEAAGAKWIDAPVVTDGNLVTSRHPDEVAAFNNAMLSFLNSTKNRRTDGPATER
jgi:protease I